MPAALVDEALRVESNRALQQGSLYAIVMGVIALITLPALMLTGVAKNLEMSLVFAAFAMSACVGVHVLARRRVVTGMLAWAVMLSFVSLPTVYFLLAHWMMPAGAATFIHGPIAYLYAGLIAVSGCLFSARLAVACGAVAAAGYLGCVTLSLEEMAKVSHPDPTLTQDLALFELFLFRALMMLFVGLVVGGLAVVAKRLMASVMVEAREKDAISRLFGEYVSQEVKDKLLGDPLSAAGETRTVVILFSDVRNFTSYSEGVSPPDLVRRLNEYFDEMVDAINEHGGVIDKFVGDAIMAVFGGVIELENPCEAAIAAARSMRDRLERLNAEWKAAGEPPFENGIGIHVGVVVQGAIGSQNRKDFTVIGDSVNVASRVEGLTKVYGQPILITAEVEELLSRDAQRRCVPLGPVSVKGRGAAIEVYGID